MNLPSTWRVGTLVGICVVAAVVAASMLLSQPQAACAAAQQIPCGHARLVGTVIGGDTQAGLANVTVSVVSTSAAGYAVPVLTEADGSYAVDMPVALVGNDFAVSASPTGIYLGSDVVAAKLISGTVTTVDFTLTVGAVVTGRVESAKTSLPLSETIVSALRYVEEIGEAGQYVLSRSATADASGFYTITGLAAGTYVMRYTPSGSGADHMSLFSGGAYSVEEAEAFSLTVPGSVQQDIAIGVGAVVEGVVRRADNHMPVEEMTVTLRNPQNETFYLARSAADGGYRFIGVPPGQYTMAAEPSFLLFPGQDGGDLIGVFYGDTRSLAEADLITVTEANLDNPANPVSRIDINLPVGGTITGRVVDAETNMPVAGIEVAVSQSGVQDLGLVKAADQTDTNGMYTITAVVPGLVHVVFSGGPKYISQAYNRVDFTLEDLENPDPAKGEPITVESGAIVTGIDGFLSRAGQVRGRVTDPDGNPIAFVNVRLEVADAPSIFFEAVTDQNGEYIGYEFPGDYHVRFSRNVICGCYNREYYTAADDPSQPAVVTLDKGTVVEGIDIVLECGVAPPADGPEELLFIPQLARP